MKGKKGRHTVRLEPAAWNMVEGHYHGDNCSTKNEYIEKAIRFYSGYLDAAGADEYLPRVLTDVLEGKLGALGSRIGRLLFKLTVELDMNANILAPWASTTQTASSASAGSAFRTQSRPMERSASRTRSAAKRGCDPCPS